LSYIAKTQSAWLIEPPSELAEYYSTTDSHWHENALQVLLDGDDVVIHDPPTSRWIVIGAAPFFLSPCTPVWPRMQRVLHDFGIVAGRDGRAR